MCNHEDGCRLRRKYQFTLVAHSKGGDENVDQPESTKERALLVPLLEDGVQLRAGSPACDVRVLRSCSPFFH